MNRAIYILIIYDMQITGVVVLIGLSIILFEVFPEKSVWSIPVRQADEHIIAVPGSGDSFLYSYKNKKPIKLSLKSRNDFGKEF